MTHIAVHFGKAGWYLALCAVATEFLISGNLLTSLGSAYISDGGALVQKLHPGSYLAICAGITTLLACAYRRRHLSMDRHIAWFIGGILLCVCYAGAMTGLGNVVVFIDTFLPAGMLALASTKFSDRNRLQLRHIVQWLIVLNACIALGEYATQSHVIQIPNEAIENDREFRPTALYDHALTGAAVTMLGLWLAPRSRGMTRWCYIALLTASLLAFGERAPVGIALLAILAPILVLCVVKAISRDFTAAHVGAAATITFGFCAGAAVFLLGGASTRLGAHLYWDSSAQVRINQFGILNTFDVEELLFGCKRADLLALIEPLRLSSRVAVIENFWLFTFAALGLFCFPVFILSLTALLKQLWRISGRSGHIMIVLFIVVASASNSLGRKSTLLVSLVACVLASTPRRAGVPC